MVLMDHVITNGKLREALDFLALIGGLFLSPLLFAAAEHIALSDHHKLDLRILKAPVQHTVSHQDLSRLHTPLRIIRTESAQFILSQIPSQTACTGPGAGQQDHPVFLLFPPL